MNLRSFVPGLAPQAQGGSRFEPAHRQRVRVHLDGEWSSGAYDRSEQRFWLSAGRGWIALRRGVVGFWTQMPPWAMDDPKIPSGALDSLPTHVR